MRRKTNKEKFQDWLSSPYMLLIYRLLASLVALSISRWMLFPDAVRSEPGIQFPFAGLQQMLDNNEEV